MQPPVVYTVGHSNRSLDELIGLLREHGVTTLVDVRRFPRSRTNPQFNTETLPAALDPAGIRYVHLAALGGRRGRAKGDEDEAAIDPAVNGAWEVQAFRQYADYALGRDFSAALGKLVALAARSVCAIMCAEAVWWRCHRRIITDHLLARGVRVVHILAPGRSEPAALTPFAVVRPDGAVHYPALVG